MTLAGLATLSSRGSSRREHLDYPDRYMATIRRKMGHLGHWPKTLRDRGKTAIDLKGLFDPLIEVAEKYTFAVRHRLCFSSARK